uniref:Eukaryotic translation initiation factor 5 n=1 Tax=Oryzias latipes TaxID=8090 RepID=A0A3P9M942_ORYLA
MSVNVNRSVSDQFYRYKMPRLIAKVEGKGNGIKTVIVNMVDVAKALNRFPFFGCELGAQTQFDTKNDRYIVNGSHEANKLQDMLDGFIKKFVLCAECDNPETDLHVNPKKQTIGTSCKACGYRGMLDTRHKLCTFILKNPPGETFPQSGSASAKKEKEKKNRKKDKENGSGSGEAGTQDSFNAPEAVFCHNNKKAQKYLMGGFECVVKLHQVQLLPRVAVILKDLYDADLLEEDVILSWAEKVSKKYVSKELAKEIHAKAAPFVKWLKEAEEESEGSEEEEEEDDENVEVVYSSSARELKVETVKPETPEKEEDDIDIDAI